MRIAEKTLALLALFGLVLFLLGITGGAMFLVLPLMLLAVIYFYFGFALFSGIRLRQVFRKASYAGIPAWYIIGGIGVGFVLSLACIAIFFKFYSLPGTLVQLNISTDLCALLVVLCCIKMKGHHRQFYVRIISRVAVFGSVCLVLLCTPSSAIRKMRYHRYPVYLEALEKSIDSPDNEQLRKKEEEERRKAGL